jgi:hypothetical protein
MGEALAVDMAVGAAMSGPGGLLAVGALAPVALGAGALVMGHSHYKQRRSINLGRPLSDMHGTMNSLKMQSIRKLSRDRHNFSKSFGNEAMRFHR